MEKNCQNNLIDFIRGDVKIISFTIVDKNGTFYDLQENDYLFFTVKKNDNNKEFVIQKSYGNGIIKEGEKYYILFSSNDTDSLDYGIYEYDIEFSNKSGFVVTIERGMINLLKESTFNINKSFNVPDITSLPEEYVLDLKSGNLVVPFIQGKQGIDGKDYQITENDYKEIAKVTANLLDPKFKSITDLIPEQASVNNKLADKDFVNSSISTNTANFIGTFNSLEELQEYSGEVTNNDYAFVISQDSLGETLYNRYKYNGSLWIYEYTLNNSSFTEEQWKSINSGITDELVTKLSDIGIATMETAGLIKLGNGFTKDENNKLASEIRSSAQYDHVDNDYVIGKGTLENIKNKLVKEALVNNNITLTDEEQLLIESWLGLDQNYLTYYNQTPYQVTSDYNPAHKKYVDEHVGDTLPINSIFEYDGTQVPEGYEEVEDSGGDTQIYTLDEQVIGKWINGKPLYRKIIEKTLTKNTTNTSSLSSLGINNPDYIAIDLGISTQHWDTAITGGCYTSLNYYANSSDTTKVEIDYQQNLFIKNTTPNTRKFTIVLVYTKTTD